MRFAKFMMSTVALLSLSGVAHANLITNPDFYATNPSPGYGPVAGWMQDPFPTSLPGFPYLSGSNTSGGAFWNNGSADGAVTVGFIQVYGPVSSDSLSQTFTLTAGQKYNFSYLENAPTASAPLVSVLLNGSALIAQHSDTAVDSFGGSNPFREYTATFTGTGTDQTLTFLVNQQVAGGDETALLTHVTLDVAKTPEPSSLALLGTGMLGAVGFVRRKVAKN